LARRIRPTAQVAMVLDREGELVFTLPPERRQAAEAISTEIFQKVSDAPSGTMIATGAQGRRQIVGYVPLSDPPTGLFIAVASDREDALAPVRQVAIRSVVFGLLAMLLAVVTTWMIVEFLIRRPIKGMVEAARSREGGENRPFPILDTTTELGELSTAL